MAVHKDCYTSLNLTQQGGLRRRETIDGFCLTLLYLVPCLTISGLCTSGTPDTHARDLLAECKMTVVLQ